MYYYISPEELTARDIIHPEVRNIYSLAGIGIPHLRNTIYGASNTISLIPQLHHRGEGSIYSKGEGSTTTTTKVLTLRHTITTNGWNTTRNMTTCQHDHAS